MGLRSIISTFKGLGHIFGILSTSWVALLTPLTQGTIQKKRPGLMASYFLDIHSPSLLYSFFRGTFKRKVQTQVFSKKNPSSKSLKIYNFENSLLSVDTENVKKWPGISHLWCNRKSQNGAMRKIRKADDVSIAFYNWFQFLLWDAKGKYYLISNVQNVYRGIIEGTNIKSYKTNSVSVLWCAVAILKEKVGICVMDADSTLIHWCTLKRGMGYIW